MTTKPEENSKSPVPEAPGCNTASKDVILQVRGLRKWYPVNKAVTFFGRDIIGKTDLLKAVDDVSFDVAIGETFGLVGESGCGKTTTGKLILQLEKPNAGNIFFEGEDVSKLSSAGMRNYRSSVQAVFQDPWASLNPRMRVNEIVGEPLSIVTTMTKEQIRKKVGELLEEVGLNEYQANFFPHEFSGGQRQRIGIARALALNPKLIILDEPVSALDVSIRAQIMNLLVDLQDEHNLAYILIAHNLATVRYMCHATAVMYLGVIQEMGETEELFNNPQHIYTNALMSAALPSHPDIDRDEIVLPGEVVSPINPPPGDVFQSRSPLDVDPKHKYASTRPPLVQVGKKDHWVVDTPWSIAPENMKVKLEAR